MKILFLTIADQIREIETPGIYNDLVRYFRDSGHQMVVMYPTERRNRGRTSLYTRDGITYLSVRTLNVTKCSILEKGAGQMLIEGQFLRAFRKYLGKEKFDIILYSTPPITFTRVIANAEALNPEAMAYLMLKDIFPQNALDLGILSHKGFKGILYNYYRNKEKKLYMISDRIGCMSAANVDYILKNNHFLTPEKVGICPNSYTPVQREKLSPESIKEIKEKYGLPTDRPLLIYGGNMGVPQGIPFLIGCIKSMFNTDKCHFVIVGDGTKYKSLELFSQIFCVRTMTLIRSLPKEEFDRLTEACDVGMIFLDYRFTIPNFPSRMLSYMMARKPILVVTDPNCDMGSIAEQNGFGIYSPSNSVTAFNKAVDRILSSDLQQMGENGFNYFMNNYTTRHTYNAIINSNQ
ncbi:MAG: glycosyltransferase family 4 protein [Candidatus Coprenecus sp.]